MQDSTASSNIRYSNYMVAYLDILGFRQMISQAEKLESIHKVMQSVKFLTDVTGYTQHFEIHRLQLSDGLLIWAKVDTYKDYMIFMFKIGSAIASLHSLKILTRGAFSYGSHFYMDEILVSPAFIEAYRYESEVAKYPRMIFTPSFIGRIEMLIAGTPPIQTRLFEFNLFGCLDSDGYRFFNYLGFLTYEPNDDQKTIRMSTVTEFKTKMARHKRVIEEAIQREADEKVRAKFIWLGNYHNNFLNSEDVKKKIDPTLIIDRNILEHRPIII